jgi:adenylate kinase
MSVKVVFLAPPAAGKGTQASLLKDYADVLHLSTGDELRDAIKQETEVGKRAKECVDAGDLVSDDIILEIVDSVFSRSEKSGWILDGFPRKESQALSLDKFLEKRKDRLYQVVYFEVSDATLLKRVEKRESEMNRSDDSLAIYMKRLKTYRESTQPLIEMYEKRGNLLKIDGEQSVEDVFSTLKVSLGL